MLPDDLDAPPFTDDDLDAYFEWEEETERLATGEPQGEEREPFPSPVVAWSVCDTNSADYAMRRLGRFQQQIAQIRADADRFYDQIKRWEAEQLRRPERAVNFFTGQLVTYARKKREEDGDKTTTVPSGKVTSRLNPARADIPKDTKQEFIEWARARELPVVKATWAPVMDEVKKHVLFRTVAFPNDGAHTEQVHDVGDTPMGMPSLLVLPSTVPADQIESLLEGLNMGNLIGYTFHERPSTAIYRRDDGSWWLVPGVVEVPAEVIYTPKPALP